MVETFLFSSSGFCWKPSRGKDVYIQHSPPFFHLTISVLAANNFVSSMTFLFFFGLSAMVRLLSFFAMGKTHMKQIWEWRMQEWLIRMMYMNTLNLCSNSSKTRLSIRVKWAAAAAPTPSDRIVCEKRQTTSKTIYHMKRYSFAEGI